jgi:hypothetical protein
MMWNRYAHPSKNIERTEQQAYDWRSELIAIVLIVVIVAAFAFVGSVWLQQQR